MAGPLEIIGNRAGTDRMQRDITDLGSLAVDLQMAHVGLDVKIDPSCRFSVTHVNSEQPTYSNGSNCFELGQLKSTA